MRRGIRDAVDLPIILNLVIRSSSVERTPEEMRAEDHTNQQLTDVDTGYSEREEKRVRNKRRDEDTREEKREGKRREEKREGKRTEEGNFNVVT